MIYLKHLRDNVRTQLLCTFAHKSNLDIVTEYIKQNFIIPEKRIAHLMQKIMDIVEKIQFLYIEKKKLTRYIR